MKLSFERSFISINGFEECDLTDFSIITGLNGVGKTHFLKAINEGAIKVDAIQHQETIYFSYSDFIIDPQLNGVSANGQIKKEKSSSVQRDYFSLHQLRSGQVLNLLNSSNLLTPYEKELLQYFRRWIVYPTSEIIFGNPQEWEKHIKQLDDSIESLDKIKNSINQNLYLYIYSLIKKGLNTKIITADFINEQLNQILKKISTTFEENFPGYYETLTLDMRRKVFDLTQSDFELPGLFLSVLQDEIKMYLFKKADNDHNHVRSLRGEEVTFLSPNEFEKKHGADPIIFFNQILETYDCNGYRFSINGYYPPHGTASNAIIIPLQLKHKDNDTVIRLEDLSSGEQTLLSLAMMIYKARKNKIFPRLLLLDEIDTSLHPSMIKRLLSVIENIFIIEKGLKVILATHSPTTVALALEDSIYILEKNKNTLKAHKSSKQNAIEFLTEGFATLRGSLDLLSYILKNKITIFSEGDNVEYLKKANTYFGSDDIEIFTGVEGMTGKNQLKILFEFFQNVKHNTIVYFVWDCDVKTMYVEKNKTIPFVFPINNENDKVLSGIENLFSKSLFEDEFYTISPKDDGGEHKTLSKKKFMNHIITNGTKEDFINFKPLFDDILSRLDQN